MKSEAILLVLLYLSQSFAFELVINGQYGEKLTWTEIPGVYSIRLYEEMDVGVILASFCYDGRLSDIGFAFITPNPNANEHLGLVVLQLDDNIFQLKITLRQDYESSYFGGYEPMYVFRVIAGQMSVLVQIALVDVNENEIPTCRLQRSSAGARNWNLGLNENIFYIRDYRFPEVPPINRRPPAEDENVV